MQIIKYFNNQSFITYISESFTDKIKCSLYLMTWEDGNGFIDICANDKGIDDYQLQMFNKKNHHYKIEKKQDLVIRLEEYIRLKTFSSKNKKFKLGFNIYIFIDNSYFVLCPEFDTAYLAKLSLFNKVFGALNSKEPWDDRVYHYSVLQKP